MHNNSLFLPNLNIEHELSSTISQDFIASDMFYLIGYVCVRYGSGGSIWK